MLQIVPSKSVVAPGEAFDVRLVSDAAQSVDIDLSGSVSGALSGLFNASAVVTVAEQLVYALSVSAGSVQQDANDPSLFHCVAP